MKLIVLTIAKWEKSGTIIRVFIGCQWNFTILCVQKIDKFGNVKIQVCIDFWFLNEVIKNSFSNNLSVIWDILLNMCDFDVISVLDLQESFTQLPIKKEDQMKTAFIWNDIWYMFIGAPYGMKHVPAHMQWMVANALAKV